MKSLMSISLAEVLLRLQEISHVLDLGVQGIVGNAVEVLPENQPHDHTKCSGALRRFPANLRWRWKLDIPRTFAGAKSVCPAGTPSRQRSCVSKLSDR